MKGYFWGIGSAIFITLAQLYLKAGVTILDWFKLNHQWMNISWLFENLSAFWLIFIGLIGYALSMVCWLFSLRFLALSKAYSLISLSYVLVYLFAITLPWFNESTTLIKFIGLVFILLGIWIIFWPEVIS
ncbi:MAG: 4-amino-4-deoxy-L-arabinose-phosphoundecaprenol flippase subunit ArnF [Arsenophonus sp. NC-WZS1-MAG3]